MAAWQLHGDDQAVFDALPIQPSTLDSWKRQSWWKQAVKDIESRRSHQVMAKTQRAMAHALDELEDRIELGDVQTKTIKGEIVSYRVPMKARDLSQVIHVLATRSEKAQQMQTVQTNIHQLDDLKSALPGVRLKLQNQAGRGSECDRPSIHRE